MLLAVCDTPLTQFHSSTIPPFFGYRPPLTTWLDLQGSFLISGSQRESLLSQWWSYRDRCMIDTRSPDCSVGVVTRHLIVWIVGYPLATDFRREGHVVDVEGPKKRKRKERHKTFFPLIGFEQRVMNTTGPQLVPSIHVSYIYNRQKFECYQRSIQLCAWWMLSYHQQKQTLGTYAATCGGHMCKWPCKALLDRVTWNYYTLQICISPFC